MSVQKRIVSGLGLSALLFWGGTGAAIAATVGSGGSGGVSGTPAGADPEVFINFTIGPDVGSADLATIALGGGQYLATSGTLNVTAGPVGTYSLISGGPADTTSPSGAFFYDNVIYPGADPVLDAGGLLFDAGGGFEINIWGNSPGNYSFYEWNPNLKTWTIADTSGTAIVSAVVPEPTTLALLGLGLAGLGFARRRKIV